MNAARRALRSLLDIEPDRLDHETELLPYLYALRSAARWALDERPQVEPPRVRPEVARLMVAVQENGWSQGLAAKALGLSRGTVNRKLRAAPPDWHVRAAAGRGEQRTRKALNLMRAGNE